MALLQMDIEGDEWVVLKQVAQQPIMDLIGQVSDRLATQHYQESTTSCSIS